MGLLEDFALLKASAKEGGAIAMRYFRRDPDSWAKAGGSPVTEADMAVDGFLHDRLLGQRPDYGWLSEETTDDPARRARDLVFVVDPIDGTKAFIAGNDTWCVSVGLVRGDRPVAAALYAPARGEFFTALAGGGAWLGAERLSVSPRSDPAGARLAGPRSWMRTEAAAGFGADIGEYVPSLAYRFALVAAERLDAAFTSPRSHDWDLAACDLLVHEAGGRLADLDGEAPRYNRESPRHDALAATNEALMPGLLAMMKEAAGEVARGKRT